MAYGGIARSGVWPLDLVYEEMGAEVSQRGWAGVARGGGFGKGSLWRVLSRRETG